MHKPRGAILTKLLQKFWDFYIFPRRLGWGGEEEGGVCTVLSWEVAVGGDWGCGPPAQAPSAAPGALKALENANLNTCRKIRRGRAGGSFARCFSLLLGGAHPLLQVKFRGIRHELGARGEAISQDIPHPKTLPRQGRPPRRSLGCHCRRRGLGKSVRVPTRKVFLALGWFGSTGGACFSKSLGTAPKPPPGAGAASPLH